MANSYYYKGLYKVKLLTESEGYWIVQAQENFEDHINGRRVLVRVGEERIVQPSDLHKRKVLAPMIPEHVYERQLEKKVKRMVERYQQETAPK